MWGSRGSAHARCRIEPAVEGVIHLDAFRRTYHGDPAPSLVYVVPAMLSGKTLSAQMVKSRMELLQHQADNVGVSMLCRPFGGRPDMSWDDAQGILNSIGRQLDAQKKTAPDRIIHRRIALVGVFPGHSNCRSAFTSLTRAILELCRGEEGSSLI